MRRYLPILGLIFGWIVLYYWQKIYPLDAVKIENSLFFPLSFLMMTAALSLQWTRTYPLFSGLQKTAVLRLVIWCHGLNTIFAVSGDIFELGWFLKNSQENKIEIARRLFFRSINTLLSALSFLIAGLLFFKTENYSLLVFLPVAGLTALFLLSSRWCYQLSLALLQSLCDVLALFCLAKSLDLKIAFSLWMLARTGVEFSTYLPIPLSGIGVHHFAITSIEQLATIPEIAQVAVLHHSLSVLFGLFCCLVGGLIWKKD